MTIWKYEIRPVDSVQRIEMPIGAKVLTFKLLGEVANIWCLVDDYKLLETRKFVIKGTGWNIADVTKLKYIGTVIDGEEFVWHLFEVKE